MCPSCPWDMLGLEPTTCLRASFAFGEHQCCHLAHVVFMVRILQNVPVCYLSCGGGVQVVSGVGSYYPCLLGGETEAQGGRWAVQLARWGCPSQPSPESRAQVPSPSHLPSPGLCPPHSRGGDGFGPAFISLLQPCISAHSPSLHFSSCKRMTSENACDPEKLSSLLFHRIIFCPLVWTSLGDF